MWILLYFDGFLLGRYLLKICRIIEHAVIYRLLLFVLGIESLPVYRPYLSGLLLSLELLLLHQVGYLVLLPHIQLSFFIKNYFFLSLQNAEMLHVLLSGRTDYYLGGSHMVNLIYKNLLGMYLIIKILYLFIDGHGVLFHYFQLFFSTFYYFFPHYLVTNQLFRYSFQLLQERLIFLLVQDAFLDILIELFHGLFFLQDLFLPLLLANHFFSCFLENFLELLLLHLLLIREQPYIPYLILCC